MCPALPLMSAPAPSHRHPDPPNPQLSYQHSVCWSLLMNLCRHLMITRVQSLYQGSLLVVYILWVLTNVSHHECIILNSFTKNPLCSAYLSPPRPINTTANPWQPTDLFTLSMVYLFPNIIYHWYPKLCHLSRLASFSDMHLKWPTCLLMAPYPLHFFCAKEYPVAWMQPSLCVHSPSEGRLGCFQFLAVMNKAAVNGCVQVSMWMQHSAHLGPLILRSSRAGRYGKNVFHFERHSPCSQSF